MVRFTLWAVLWASPIVCMYLGTDMMSIRELATVEEFETWLKAVYNTDDRYLGRILGLNAQRLNDYTELSFCFNMEGAQKFIDTVLKKQTNEPTTALNNFMDLLGYTSAPAKGSESKIVMFKADTVLKIKVDTLDIWLQQAYSNVFTREGTSLYKKYLPIVEKWAQVSVAPSLSELNHECATNLGQCAPQALKASMVTNDRNQHLGCVQGWFQEIGVANVVNWLAMKFEVGYCVPIGAAWELRLLMFANSFFDVWTGEGYTGRDGQRGTKEYLYDSRPLNELEGVSLKFKPNP
eukprot:TRINITY_DN77832_c0_g1_i1.p1 TRINITY_DN77832_c0_g1~~TRINITY_DN77832_c0_g1_i1.p1  ORF type:complete len:313 (+),score=34.07 TRINITY_DN77832_c0_g1_i1:62-940(+)